MPLPILSSEEFANEHMSETMVRPTDRHIPAQRLPGWIRWPIRALIVPFLWIDLAMQKLARMIVRPPYKRVGSCKERGACCYYILIEERKGWLGKLYMLWHTEINGFYPRQMPLVQEGKQTFRVMGCRYLKRSGKCGHYKLRPMICRKWPIIEHFGDPQILKGCGFRACSRLK
jgi:Fe-S-cluster containining protein